MIERSQDLIQGTRLERQTTREGLSTFGGVILGILLVKRLEDTQGFGENRTSRRVFATRLVGFMLGGGLAGKVMAQVTDRDSQRSRR